MVIVLFVAELLEHSPFIHIGRLPHRQKEKVDSEQKRCSMSLNAIIGHQETKKTKEMILEDSQ